MGGYETKDLFGKALPDLNPKRFGSGHPEFYLCQIEAVSEDLGRAWCRAPVVGKTFENCIICKPYAHFDSDEGIHLTPRVGAWSFVMTDGGQNYLLPWFFAPLDPSNGGFLGKARTNSHQGDIWLGTRDDNYIEILSGGDIRIFSHGFLQFIFSQAIQTLKALVKRYIFQSDAGIEEWLSDDKGKAWYRKEVTVKAAQKALYRERINKDEHFIIELYNQAGDEKFGFINWKSDGNIEFHTDHNTHIYHKGTLVCDIDSDTNINTKALVVITGQGAGDAKWIAREGDGIEGKTEVAFGHTHPITITNAKIKEHSKTTKST